MYLEVSINIHITDTNPQRGLYYYEVANAVATVPEPRTIPSTDHRVDDRQVNRSLVPCSPPVVVPFIDTATCVEPFPSKAATALDVSVSTFIYPPISSSVPAPVITFAAFDVTEVVTTKSNHVPGTAVGSVNTIPAARSNNTVEPDSFTLSERVAPEPDITFRFACIVSTTSAVPLSCDILFVEFS